MRYTFSRLASVALALTLFGGGRGFAQYPGYYPPPGYGGFGPGNVLRGQADLLQAQGQSSIDMEQARITREKALQAKQDTKRKAFDEMMYEKANTPTYTQEQAKIDSMVLQRIMAKPSETEVITGKAQNILLPYLQKLSNLGIQGPPVTLDQGLLKEVNVTAGTKGSVGPLKNGGKLDWPLALQGKEQEKVAGQIISAVSEASRGKLNAKLSREIQNTLTNLGDDARKRWLREEIESSDYLEAKRFLEPVQAAVKALGQPGSKKFLDGTYSARGNTVQELVENMGREGLLFAPATSGAENAYFALQSALTGYAQGAETSSAFQVRFGAPVHADAWSKFRKS